MAEECGAQGYRWSILAHLHPIVTYGPWDLDIAAALSPFGYDEVQWAEGQWLVAELVSDQEPVGGLELAALEWYTAVATAARSALADRPYLLAKLGLGPCLEDSAAAIAQD